MLSAILRNRNLACLVFGRLVSNAGDGLYTVASMWLVYELGGSAIFSGIAGFLIYLPELSTVFIGPFIDRFDRRRLLIAFELLQALIILAMVGLSYTGRLTMTAILIAAPLLTFCIQVTYPAESALLPDTAPPEDLVHANSAMSFSYQSTSLIFKSIAGLLVSLFGAINIFLLNALSFVLAAWLFSRIRIGNGSVPPVSGGAGALSFRQYVRELREGLGFIKDPLILKPSLCSVAANFSTSAMFAALPAFSAQAGGAELYGVLLAVPTAGMIAGSFLAGWLADRVPIGKLLGFSSVLTGVFSFAGYVFATSYIYLSIALLLLSGIPWGVSFICKGSLRWRARVS